jgi:hypothetical protein
VVDDSFGFDDVAFARQSRSLLLFDEDEGEETTTGVLESIVILSREYISEAKTRESNFWLFLRRALYEQSIKFSCQLSIFSFLFSPFCS